jgi:hypothetical protein
MSEEEPREEQKMSNTLDEILAPWVGFVHSEYDGTSMVDDELAVIATAKQQLLALIAREQEKLLAELEKDAKYNYTTWGNSNKMLSVDGINKWIAAKRQALNKIIEER